MIDLTKFQHDTYNNALRLGYRTDKKSTLIHLKSEFKAYFEHNIKDTEIDEIPDTIFILMSYCEHMGYDTESLLMIKNRYNKLR